MQRSIRMAGLVALAAGVYGVLIRPRMLRWGTTAEERDRSFPRPDIVPGGKRGSTMAVTIDAPPSEVWPWLIQMGCDRAGFYSWDLLDNGGRASAEEIRSDWQSTKVGDRIFSTPNREHWFEVAALEPERFLALRACFTGGGRQYDARALRPAAFSDTLWAFELHMLPGNRTRLVVTTFGAVSGMRAMTLLNYMFWEPAHWIMQKRQFDNLKRRAETAFAAGKRSPKASIASSLDGNSGRAGLHGSGPS